MSSLLQEDMLSDDLVRLLENKINAGFWTFDVANRTFFWSSGMLRLLGVQSGMFEPSDNILCTLQHPQDRVAGNEFVEFLERGLSFEREFRIIQPSGRLRWLLSRGDVILDPVGQPKKTVAVTLDTTDRHEREQALSFPYLRLREIVTCFAPIVWTARTDGSLIQVVFAPELLAHRPMDFAGMPWSTWVHEDDALAVESAWKAAMHKQASFEVEHRLRSFVGHHEWYRTTARPVLDEEGALKHWNGLCLGLERRPSQVRRDHVQVLAAAQIRAARAILRWSVSDLSERSAVSPAVIRRLEDNDSHSARDDDPMVKLKTVLQDAGIEFLFFGDGEPATRARTAAS